MKQYILKPNMTFSTVTTGSHPGKPADPDTQALVESILPESLKGRRATSKPLLSAPALVPARPHHQPLPTPVIDPKRPMLKLGLDVHLDFIMAVAQQDHSNPKAPRKFTRLHLVEHVRQRVAEGFQVFCVQESCGFGFTLHRQLVEAGAQSFLITPIALNGKRKNDKLDARQLCLRLSRWLDGNRDELSPIRIPSQAEQRRREASRRRKFLGRLIRMLANRGHGQVAQYHHVKLPGRWWGPRNWKKLEHLDPWVREQLEHLRQAIGVLEAQMAALEEELVARVQDQPRPKGLGEISLVTLDGEVCDWHRFNNRKQIGSYTGCCPGEYPTAEGMRTAQKVFGDLQARALAGRPARGLALIPPLQQSA